MQAMTLSKEIEDYQNIDFTEAADLIRAEIDKKIIDKIRKIAKMKKKGER